MEQSAHPDVQLMEYPDGARSEDNLRFTRFIRIMSRSHFSLVEFPANGIPIASRMIICATRWSPNEPNMKQ